ncbi:serine--tRNA ligase [Sedimentibacter sp. zth1]|uniref:serine--tRNA ligase n=1 Tax=Sedimentibacter sp. zth1 TaxID=2816908 RepID=UPI001A90E24E|nr:serine--tRNA ligase [Sedimentibacter sp. zth1]QSX05173.1 serine--tRNA ligase [Sedimentibacter sp. zth1]
MLEIRQIRKNPKKIEELLKRKNPEISLDKILNLDFKKRNILLEVEQKKAEHNLVSKQIPQLKKECRDISTIVYKMRKLSDNIKNLDKELDNLDKQIKEELLSLPNTPNETVIVGKSDIDNKEIRKIGNPTEFNFCTKPHWDLGVNLDILDFERAGKITGPRFSIYKGKGAMLERALTQFMLDTHVFEHGFLEVATPYMVNKESMLGTGQLPKFKDDMFEISNKEYYLVPTAEVPVTNIYRNEILKETELPLCMTAYTPCFRLESGSACRDTRGLIRNHQFDKVEMVIYSKPQNSYENLEKLTGFAENILKKLELPYRVIELCTGDLGFSASKTYDIEVWMPSYNRYVEISSCTNFEDYQARRANIKYKDSNKKHQYIHTLNGSGLAVGRTFAAILENYQNIDGSVDIPKVLIPYMRGISKIIS